MMNKIQFCKQLQGFKSKNGYAFHPDQKSHDEPASDGATNIFNFVGSIDQINFNDAERLGPAIVAHLKEAGATVAEVIGKDDLRKKFCDVFFKRNGKTAAIIIGNKRSASNGVDHFFHVHDQKSFINFLKGSRLKETKIF